MRTDCSLLDRSPLQCDVTNVKFDVHLPLELVKIYIIPAQVLLSKSAFFTNNIALRFIRDNNARGNRPDIALHHTDTTDDLPHMRVLDQISSFS